MKNIPTQRERIRIAKELNQYPVIVITHAKYKVLAKNSSIHKLFTKNRKVLIMDEFVSVRETIEITLPIINTFKELFRTDVVVYQEFSKIVAGLEDKLMASLADNERHFMRIENGYIIGSNNWVNVKNIAIIHTPNLNDFEYILTYLYYNKNYIENNITFAARRHRNKMVTRYQFDDPKLEKIRTQWIATEIYQAVKRVNRNMVYDTECLLP